MTRIADFKSAADDGFVPALNEELKETRRRLERKAERHQKITGISIPVVAGVGTREVRHDLGSIPKLVVVDVFTNNTVSVTYYKAHTSESIFIRVFSAATVTLDVVLRG